LAVAVNRNGVAVEAIELAFRLGSAERFVVPYSPASSTGPYLTPCTAPLSGVASRYSAIGRVRSTTSPLAQVRLRVA
jgi:hypothetical protein